VEQGPVVWDEPFARLDDQRMRQVAAALEKICAQRQVVILTRDRRFAQAGEIQALGGDTRAPVRTESRT
jgi:DNA repair exonuclease SbcCD ATPase subunit